MLCSVTPEEVVEMRQVKWSKISLDVLENILRNHGVEVDYEESSAKKRWIVVEAVRKIFDEEVEKDRMSVEINMLEKRCQDIIKTQPQFRKSTDITLKRKITELSKYGLDVWYNEDINIRKFAMKVYAIAKLGLQLPSTEEGINSLLLKYKRKSFLK